MQPRQPLTECLPVSPPTKHDIELPYMWKKKGQNNLSILFPTISLKFDVIDLAWLGLAWLGLAWLGLAWLGLAPLQYIYQLSSDASEAFQLKGCNQISFFLLSISWFTCDAVNGLN